MAAIDPASLPYPPAKLVIRHGEAVPLNPEIIDAASAQCLDLSVRDSEGVLYFQGPGMGFYSDSGTLHDWSFESIDSYHVKRGWVRPWSMRMLVVVVDGHRFRFRIGHMLAANAGHILRAARAEAESQEQ
jgi:hypothetical protein